jgi:D-glycerate 3-kinase
MRSLDLKIIKAEKKYFRFIKAQEVLAEPFRDKSSQFKNFYLPISDLIFKNYIKDKKTKIIGLTGGQGSGKSTISNILKIILKEIYKLETVIFSIDDFYKTIKQRRSISKKVSHLFLTRGVPGTHDTKLMMDCFKKLKNKKFKKLLIPKFDKSIDDRLPKKKWQKIKKKPNIIIFEGWCVGATPQKNEELSIPINILETEKDKNNIWRKKVNYELKTSYKKIFNLVDEFIYLKVPSFKHVLKWRLLQEKKLKMKSKGKKIMTDEQIKNFIMYYERITKHMLKNFSSKARVVIKIDDKHRLKSIKLN